MSNPNQIKNQIITPEQSTLPDQVEPANNPSTESDPNAMMAEADKEYSRQHADGTVHQGSADVALRECTAFQGKTRSEVVDAISMAELGKELRAAAKLKSTPDKVTAIEKEKSEIKEKPAQVEEQPGITTTSINSLPHQSIAESQPMARAKQEIAPKPTSIIYKEIFEQHVQLEKLAVVPAEIVAEPIPKILSQSKTLDKRKMPPVVGVEKSVISIAEIPQLQIPETIPQNVLAEQDQGSDFADEQVTGDLIATEEFSPIPIALIESYEGEVAIDGYPLAERSALLETKFKEAAELGDISADDRSIIATEFDEPVPAFEISPQVEKTPSVIVAEFILQVLPAVTQEVYERVQEMEPIEAAEVAAQIETIGIVADRLHELVVAGKTDGEEAQQIEAYLKREYEQLLVSVGIEPTEKIIDDFIRYIFSAEYQIQAQLNMNNVEVIDEGTHEKKLFDEQSVFSRAQAASINLSRRLDRAIGKLVFNYLN